MLFCRRNSPGLLFFNPPIVLHNTLKTQRKYDTAHNNIRITATCVWRTKIDHAVRLLNTRSPPHVSYTIFIFIILLCSTLRASGDGEFRFFPRLWVPATIDTIVELNQKLFFFFNFSETLFLITIPISQPRAIKIRAALVENLHGTIYVAGILEYYARGHWNSRYVLGTFGLLKLILRYLPTCRSGLEKEYTDVSAFFCRNTAVHLRATGMVTVTTCIDFDWRVGGAFTVFIRRQIGWLTTKPTCASHYRSWPPSHKGGYFSWTFRVLKYRQKLFITTSVRHRLKSCPSHGTFSMKYCDNLK